MLLSNGRMTINSILSVVALSCCDRCDHIMLVFDGIVSFDSCVSVGCDVSVTVGL